MFDETTSTQVLEDLASAVDLKTILVSPDNETILLPSAGLYVGQNLGVWLRGFHEWTSVPAQDEFRELVAKNRAMQELKHRLACNGALKAAQDFPELFDDNMEWAKQVEEASAKELEQSLSNSNNDWGVIHGDFWTGK